MYFMTCVASVNFERGIVSRKYFHWCLNPYNNQQILGQSTLAPSRQLNSQYACRLPELRNQWKWLSIYLSSLMSPNRQRTLASRDINNIINILSSTNWGPVRDGPRPRIMMNHSKIRWAIRTMENSKQILGQPLLVSMETKERNFIIMLR